MLAILVSWIVISYTLFSIGDIFVSIYNKLCGANERYNILDSVLLGMCFISILLPLTSLWLPSNHYILFAYIIISTLYWVFNKRRLSKYVKKIKENCQRLTIAQKCFLILTLFLFVGYLLIGYDFYDAGFYHHQNIRWNEEYSVVPGLGNLEDRFGFNSNTLLLSAIFSFRFLFGHATYLLHTTLFVLLLVWTISRLFRSNYESRYIFLFIFLFIIFVLMNNSVMLTDSSTDAIPLLCTFYYIAKTSLKPTWLNNQLLLAFILPVTLITFKLSSAVFCLISVILLIYCFRKKKNKTIVFLFTCSLLIVGLWLIRNVIISGYLIYPLYEIDLFSFDWKILKATAMIQKEHIYHWAKYMLENHIVGRIFIEDWSRALALNLFSSMLNFSLFILFLLSPLLIILNLTKKYISINKNIYYVYAISLICFIVGIMSAPDLRFLNGYILGSSFLLVNTILLFLKKDKTNFPKFGKIIAITVSILCIVVTLKHNRELYDIYFTDKSNNYATLLFKPSHARPENTIFDEYKLGEITIYVTHTPGDKPFDKLPATSSGGMPCDAFMFNKTQSITTIELRGKTLQDGFRTKEEYIEPINQGINEIISIYHKGYDN